jgi:hypothetical protein
MVQVPITLGPSLVEMSVVAMSLVEVSLATSFAATSERPASSLEPEPPPEPSAASAAPPAPVDPAAPPVAVELAVCPLPPEAVAPPPPLPPPPEPVTSVNSFPPHEAEASPKEANPSTAKGRRSIDDSGTHDMPPVDGVGVPLHFDHGFVAHFAANSVITRLVQVLPMGAT